jgi:ATP-dependent DNA helicase RecG
MIAQTTPSKLLTLKGVGPKFAQKLARLKIQNPTDILYHLPLKYLDLSSPITVSQITPGVTVLLTGTFGRLFSTPKTLRSTFTDPTGKVNICWFNQPYVRYSLRPNTTYLIRGAATVFNNKLQITNPLIFPSSTSPLIPIYPQTEGFKSGHSRQLISKNFDSLITEVPEVLPSAILKKFKLISTPQALRLVHFPTSATEAQTGQKRLLLNEHLSLLAQNHLLGLHQAALRPTHLLRPQAKITKKLNQFISNLPYPPTPSQSDALIAIIADLNKACVTNRLLTGDVGSGKSLVIFLSCLYLYLHGHTSFIVAPTKILAAQHFANFNALFPDVHCQLVTTHHRLSPSSNPTIYIGTQALLKPSSLSPALVVFDEQHRFGVAQRSYFSTANTSPHLVTVSATPIPRSLQLTYFQHLSVSSLDRRSTQLPSKTYLLTPKKEKEFYPWLVNQVTPTNQAFIVCPHIEITDSTNPVATVIQEYEYLKFTFPHLSVGLIHSGLKPAVIEAEIARFLLGDTLVLVATPIIEVGVDIPMANIMLIKSASRFGLSQLHQLRGRVGRGSRGGFCFLSEPKASPPALARLEYFCNHQDGREIADYDLKVRGPGQFLSLTQHGFLPSLITLSNNPDAFIEAKRIIDQLASNLPLLTQLAQNPTVNYTITN